VIVTPDQAYGGVLFFNGSGSSYASLCLGKCNFVSNYASSRVVREEQSGLL